MVTLLDRYSYFYKLLPLLLTGIEDEVPGIADKSVALFEAAGKQWEEENEQDIKVGPVSRYWSPQVGCKVVLLTCYQCVFMALALEPHIMLDISYFHYTCK